MVVLHSEVLEVRAESATAAVGFRCRSSPLHWRAMTSIVARTSH